MGYQESLVLVRPQWRMESILAEYFTARSQDPWEIHMTELQAVLTTLAPIPELNCPSGTIFLWVTGERSGSMLAGAMPEAWKPPQGTLLQHYAAEIVHEKFDPTFLAGLQQGNVTYNKWFKYTPLTLYAAEKEAKENTLSNRSHKQNTNRKDMGR